MLFKNKTDYLIESIRKGRAMTRREKLNLIVGLSVPSMLAQISTVMMFFIDASMVGHLGAEASASIGLIESTTWLIGSLLSAAATGFSVQVAHFIGANDFRKARQVYRHALIFGLAFSLMLTLVGVGIHGYLPYWLGGGDDIAPFSSKYFLIYSLVLPFVFLYHISEMMLKSAGNMHTPSVMAVLICLCDVVFNYLFIYILKMGVVGAACGTAMAYFCISLLPSSCLFCGRRFCFMLPKFHVTVKLTRLLPRRFIWWRVKLLPLVKVSHLRESSRSRQLTATVMRLLKKFLRAPKSTLYDGLR